MSLLDVAREEDRRRREGLRPLSIASRPTRGWLRRSGHDWKIRAAQWVSFVPVVAIVASFVAARSSSGAHPPRWVYTLFSAGMMASVPIGAAVFALYGSVRCRVCGLRLGSCAAARQQGWKKWLWATTLEACPACGDDGAASEPSRLRWAESGSGREPAYWSLRRVVTAVAVGVAMAAALLWYVLGLKAS